MSQRFVPIEEVEDTSPDPSEIIEQMEAVGEALYERSEKTYPKQVFIDHYVNRRLNADDDLH